MNKTAIKNFSIWARNKLIDDIKYRAGLVGVTEDGIQSALPQSAGGTEFYDIGTGSPYAISGEAVKQRQMLTEVIRAKEWDTDYKTAYKYIVEEVAYTWFNRLIAVRFMEVNDYLPSHIRVLSSDTGKLEPDLVTTPFQSDLCFSEKEEKAILQLKQDNKIDELFRLLFIKQCNALNEVLPRLFEQTADYTELLLSVSVVDTDGVVYHLVHDIPEDDFNVEKGGQVEIIGWLYQYWNTEPKDAVFSRPSGQKIKKDEIPAATQLFTPIWIVHYMVENSLGRLWVEGHPNDDLKANWKYYIDEAEQETSVQAQLAEIRKEYATLNPEDLKCIDPCMGSGNILCYLFDVLMQIYESQGWPGRDAVRSILENNLYGLDIDDRAYQLAYFAVMMRAVQYDSRFLRRKDADGRPDVPQPHVYATTSDAEGENFGSLLIVDANECADSDEIEGQIGLWDYRRLLSQKYHVVVTNPPYMGSSGMNEKLSDYVKKNYPDSKGDLFAAFIEHGNNMVVPNGMNCMVTMQSWMFLSSFEKMRIKIMQSRDITNLMHMENMVLGIAFGTAVTCFRNSHTKGYKGTYNHITLKDIENEKPKQFPVPGNRFAQVSTDNFSKIPGAPVAYWVSEKFIETFKKGNAVSKGATPKQGMSTCDVNRFVKNWFEVELNCTNIFDRKNHQRWVIYNKGGEYRRWYGNRESVVLWNGHGDLLKDNNAALRNQDSYFNEFIAWTKISSANTGFRDFEEDFLFDGAGGSLFVRDKELKKYYLGYLNSKACSLALRVISPTLNFNESHIGALPMIIDMEHKPVIDKLVTDNISLSRTDWDSFETSWDFQRHPLLPKTQKIPATKDRCQQDSGGDPSDR